MQQTDAAFLGARLSVLQKGFTLIELAVVMTLLAVLVGAGWAATGISAKRARSLEAARLPALLEQGLHRFIADAGRLPCPDADGDGFEDCETMASRLGGLPYRTLGVEARGQTGGRGLLYGADPALQAPAIVGASERQSLPGPLVRFCAALADRVRSGSNEDALTVAAGGECRSPAAHRPAFVIVSAGPSDADGDGSVFDGLNAAAADGLGSCVEPPARPADARYDDRVRAVGAVPLYGRMCTGGGKVM